MTARITLILACIIPVACSPAVRNLAHLQPERYPPKPADAFIEVHEAPSPDELRLEREYQLIARFEVRQQAYVRSGLIETARDKARELGGDAILIATPDRFAGSDLFDLDRLTVWVLRYSDRSN